MLPDGDFVGGGMAKFVTNTASKRTKEDANAVIVYLRSIPPIHNRVKKEEKNGDEDWN